MYNERFTGHDSGCYLNSGPFKRGVAHDLQRSVVGFIKSWARSHITIFYHFDWRSKGKSNRYEVRVLPEIIFNIINIVPLVRNIALSAVSGEAVT